MKKSALLVTSIFLAVVAFLAPLTSKAIDLQSDFTGTQLVITPEPSGLGAAAGVMIFALWCGIIIFAFATTIIWVLSLIDIVKRENWKNDNDKIIWLLLVVFINVASLYYYFFYRKQLDREVPSTPVEPVANPQK